MVVRPGKEVEEGKGAYAARKGVPLKRDTKANERLRGNRRGRKRNSKKGQRQMVEHYRLAVE